MGFRYDNAGLQSKEEAMTRMIAGEVFYTHGNKIWYEFDGRESPFLTRVNGRVQPVDGYWYSVKNWKTRDDVPEPKWYDDLSEPVPCWVWDVEDEDEEEDTPNPRNNIGLVVAYKRGARYQFETTDNSFSHAEPLKEGDLEY